MNDSLRDEEVVVVTADGVESFTDFLPAELSAMERAVRGEGILRQFSASPPPSSTNR